MVTSLLSLSFLVLLSQIQILSSLFPTAFAIGRGQPVRPPEPPLDISPASRPQPPSRHGIPDSGTNPAGNLQGSAPPFSEEESGSKSAEDLTDLAVKIKDLIDDFLSLFPDTSSTISSGAPAQPTVATQTTPTKEPNATLACEIYQTYTSLCPPTTVTPFTLTLTGLTSTGLTVKGLTLTVGSSDASWLADSVRASCLCYSSSYFVPYVYDEAVWACAGYTDDSFASAASAAAALTDYFCSSIGNVRTTASYATFGQYAAATTPTSTSTSTPSTSASTSSVGSGSTSAAGRSYEALKSGAWAGAAAVAAVAVLI